MTALRTEYLDPELLEQLGNIQAKAKALAEGIIAGLHRSPHRGGSVEFAEYIEYSPGHEIRHIDWRVYGKSDKFYVKQFQDETNLRVYFVLDGSGSMAFQSEDAPLSKLRYVSLMSAALAHLYIRQGDAVGGVHIDGSSKVGFLPASSKRTHLDDFLFMVDGLRGKGETSLERALRTIAERARPRSQVIVMSDMLDADAETLNLLSVLRKRRYEISVFHVVDPAELTLPYEGLTLFEDMEGGETLLADPDDLRDRYKAAFGEHLDRIKLGCQRTQVEYLRFTTTSPLEEVALQYLRARS